jgi:Protein of unknown function (DUF4011)
MVDSSFSGVSKYFVSSLLTRSAPKGRRTGNYRGPNLSSCWGFRPSATLAAHLSRSGLEGCMPEERPEETHVPQVSEGFFRGDVARGVERMRLRLLDLSSRNRLLNFRHGKRSSLQLVGEIPEVFYPRLRDGMEFFFKPVPKPDHENRELPARVSASGGSHHTAPLYIVSWNCSHGSLAKLLSRRRGEQRRIAAFRSHGSTRSSTATPPGKTAGSLANVSQSRCKYKCK